MKSSQKSFENLKSLLNRLQEDYHQAHYLDSDPLEFAHRYRDPRDQEAIALLAAVLAYGNVKQIRKSLEDASSRIRDLAPTPTEFVLGLNRAASVRAALKKFNGFSHRFNVGSDLVLLFRLLNRSWAQYGTLGNHFAQFLSPSDTNIGQALSCLMNQWRKWIADDLINTDYSLSTFSYLLTSPDDGSCCKRWCMFLRWMGRKDAVDLGLWSKFVKPSQLVMPLDTHTGRISQYLGLTTRKSINWKAALDVTAALKTVDPEDPTRYDFALARLGILDICQRSYRKEICQKCQLLTACQFAQKSMKKPLNSLSHSMAP